MKSPKRSTSCRSVMVFLLAAATLGGCSGTAVIDCPGADARPVPDSGNGVDGGLEPDPGLVDCDGTLCETPRQFCCVEDPGGRLIWQCMQESDDTPCGALVRECDEAADCPAHHRCCVPMTARPFPAYSTHCAPECDSFHWFQVCKTSTECPGQTSCVLQFCEGEPLQTCGALHDPHDFCR